MQKARLAALGGPVCRPEVGAPIPLVWRAPGNADLWPVLPVGTGIVRRQADETQTPTALTTPTKRGPLLGVRGMAQFPG